MTRARERYELCRKAEAEREVIHIDQLTAHGLEPAVLEGLVAQLREVPAVRRAYLMRQLVKFMPERPLYVLGIEPWERSQSDLDAAEIGEVLPDNLEFPAACVVVPLIRETRDIFEVMGASHGAHIYERY